MNTEYINENIEQSKNYLIRVEVEDEAGHITYKETTVTSKTIPSAIEEKTDGTFKENIVYSNVTWANENAKVDLSTDTIYEIQYKVNDGEYTNGTTVTGLVHNDKVYARLTDGLNVGPERFITIKDEEKPTAPTLSIKEGTIGEEEWYVTNVKIKVSSGTDSKSGVDRVTYTVNGGEERVVQNETIEILDDGLFEVKAYTYDKAGNKSEVSNTISFKEDKTLPVVAEKTAQTTTSSVTVNVQATDAMSQVKDYKYTIKYGQETKEFRTENATYTFEELPQTTEISVFVSVTDKAGNNTGDILVGTVTTKTIPSAVESVVFGNATWREGKASVELSTDTIYEVQYKINDGEYTNGTTVTGLVHNDKVYARLADGTNVGPETFITIKDTIAPAKPTFTVDGTIGENEWYQSIVKVNVTPGEDNESGVEKVTYTIGNSQEQEVVNGVIELPTDGIFEVKAYTYDKSNGENKSEANTIIIKEDKTAPVIGTKSVQTTTSTVKVNAEASDATSQVKDYKYTIKYVKDGEEKQETYTTVNSSYTFTDLPQDTEYEVYVNVSDNAGNHTEDVLVDTARTSEVPSAKEELLDGTIKNNITFGEITWSGERASVILTTDTIYKIQYKVNDGEWTNNLYATNTLISELKHNDVLYARLSDGVNYGQSTNLKIEDLNDPTAPTLTLINDPTGLNEWYKEDATIDVLYGVDNESGVDRITYVINNEAEVILTNNTIVITEDGEYEIKAYTYDKA